MDTPFGEDLFVPIKNGSWQESASAKFAISILKTLATYTERYSNSRLWTYGIIPPSSATLVWIPQDFQFPSAEKRLSQSPRGTQNSTLRIQHELMAPKTLVTRSESSHRDRQLLFGRRIMDTPILVEVLFVHDASGQSFDFQYHRRKTLVTHAYTEGHTNSRLHVWTVASKYSHDSHRNSTSWSPALVWSAYHGNRRNFKMVFDSPHITKEFKTLYHTWTLQ